MYLKLETFIKSKTEIDEATLKKICSHFILITTKRNEILLNYDQVSNHYYFINKGCIRLFTTDKYGAEHSRYFAFEGNFATALPVLLTKNQQKSFCKLLKNRNYFVFQELIFMI